ncbi:MAG: hypothetical protein H7A21_09145 [Spirochaetales bacterium]|nr:hypothetical protein [Leptospiraceae bacterium]MCP5481585.1 hypothetical protein [Spirochaetales bacterium]MCP5484413.1 hypothetical protein [Spirochaetales bacterium]
MNELRKAILESLSISLNAEQVQSLMQEVDPEFDLGRATGFVGDVIIPRQIAVQTALSYFASEKDLMQFVGVCLRRDGSFIRGVQLQIRNRQGLLAALRREDWVYESDTGVIKRVQQDHLTADWGYLRTGREYAFCFCSFDVVGSSVLRESNVKQDIERTLDRLYDHVRKRVEARDGRIWQWSGDGGLAAFVDRYSIERSTIAMIDVLTHLPEFNLRDSVLEPGSDIKLRIAMHHASIAFHEEMSRHSHPEIEVAENLQAETQPDTIWMTHAVFGLLPNEIKKGFRERGDYRHYRVYEYALN